MAPHPPAPDRFERAANPDERVRAEAADELAFDPTSQASALLQVLLERDIAATVRARAATAIARRGDRAFEGALARASQTDPDPTARATAATAYRRLWAARKRPGTAAGLAVLCPGCGHFYLGQTTAGSAYLATTLGLFAGGVALVSGQTVATDGTPRSARVPLAIPILTAGQNLWFYSIFDAYRDARLLRDDRGYRFDISRESLSELAIAPFHPRVLKQPWVWAGVPLALAVGIAASYAASPSDFTTPKSIFEVDRVNVFGRRFHRGRGYALGAGYFAAMFEPVGIGEEALFRGVIQSELEERFGPIGGLIVASAVFGAAHVFNFLDDPKQALIAVPVITLVGSSLGLAYQRTDHRLATGVAMHFWYDTLLSLAAFAVDPDHQPFVVNYGAAF